MQFLRERLGLVLLIGVVAAMLLYSLRLAQEARDPRFSPCPSVIASTATASRASPACWSATATRCVR
jgi:hypothetical protein